MCGSSRMVCDVFRQENNVFSFLTQPFRESRVDRTFLGSSRFDVRESDMKLHYTELLNLQISTLRFQPNGSSSQQFHEHLRIDIRPKTRQLGCTTSLAVASGKASSRFPLERHIEKRSVQSPGGPGYGFRTWGSSACSLMFSTDLPIIFAFPDF